MAETEEKLHYDSLIKFFKFLVSAMGIIVLAAMWIIGSSLNEIKKNASDEVIRLTAEIQSMKTESEQAMKDKREEADRQMEDLRKDMGTFLSFSRDVTQMEMTTASETAKNLALSSAKERIEEAFKANNVQLLVDSAARKVVGDRLNLIVEEAMKKTETTFDQFATLISLVDRIRAMDRTAVDALDSLAHSSDDPNVRRQAYYLLLQKGKDYDNDVDSLVAHHMVQPSSFKQLGVVDTQLVTPADTMRVLSALEDIILTTPDLYTVSNAFVALRQLTKMDIKTFDITVVRRLRRQAQ